MGTAVQSLSGFEPEKYPKYPDNNKQDTQYHIYWLHQRVLLTHGETDNIPLDNTSH